MKCPGQDSRYWSEGSIFEVPCPECGEKVEFFKDESKRKCPGCGHRFLNPQMDFGCAAYCQFAEQCLGEIPAELATKREELLKDRVAVAMKQYFEKDFKRIGHASKAAGLAERLVFEEGGDPATVIIAAYLHNLGEKQGEAAEPVAEAGAREARRILERLGAKQELIEQVCSIIAGAEPGDSKEAVNANIVADAERIASWSEAMKRGRLSLDEAAERMETELLTAAGRELARRELLE
jgi:hypothetical protein